jgi:hypothetical protein
LRKALIGLFLSPADKTIFVTIVAITMGGLLLVATLPRLSEFSITLKGVTAKLDKVKDTVDEQQRLINQLVYYSMSASVFRHLCGIALLHEYKYNNKDEHFRREMYFLRDHGFIRPNFLVFEELHGRNLVELAEPTEIGWTIIKLRKTEIPSDWLEAIKSPNLRIDPFNLKEGSQK